MADIEISDSFKLVKAYDEKGDTHIYLRKEDGKSLADPDGKALEYHDGDHLKISKDFKEDNIDLTVYLVKNKDADKKPATRYKDQDPSGAPDMVNVPADRRQVEGAPRPLYITVENETGKPLDVTGGHLFAAEGDFVLKRSLKQHWSKQEKTMLTEGTPIRSQKGLDGVAEKVPDGEEPYQEFHALGVAMGKGGSISFLMKDKSTDKDKDNDTKVLDFGTYSGADKAQDNNARWKETLKALAVPDEPKKPVAPGKSPKTRADATDYNAPSDAVLASAREAAVLREPVSASGQYLQRDSGELRRT